jgi:uncharacterized phage protein (predicted DNA packaging)
MESDFTDYDDTILDLLLVADEYVKSATGFTFDLETPEIAKHIVRLLVSHWYDNRAIETSQQTYKVDFTVKTLLTQLSYSHVEDDTL